MKYKFGICGPFDFEEKQTGGQSVKTREFYYALCDRVGKENIMVLESTDYRKNAFCFFAKFIAMLRRCEHIIMFPAQNGIKVFAPLCSLLKGKTKVHYCVIGGWLPQMLKDNLRLLKQVSKLDTVLVETNVMKQDLEQLGLSNVHRLLNFKRLQPVSEIAEIHKPVRLCYFSRVTKQKGIEDAIAVVEKINSHGTKCIFDIYGPIVDNYEKEFLGIVNKSSSDIRYMGKIDPSKSIDTIKEYDLQVFPTLFRTEGIPGSIIDSYFAAVPVVASKWNSFSDVVSDGKTGVGFELGDRNDFFNVLNVIVSSPERVAVMRRNCLNEAEKYFPNTVICELLEIIHID